MTKLICSKLGQKVNIERHIEEPYLRIRRVKGVSTAKPVIFQMKDM